MTEDILPDDDRVVHDDTEHEDEREEGHDVDRYIEARHQRDRPEKRDRDPEADPEGQTQFQEQRQHDEHQDEPAGATPQHQTESCVQHLRLVLPDGERDPGRHTSLRLFDVFVDAVGDLERTLFPGPEHRDHHGGLDVETGVLIRFGKAIDHGGHVAQL